MLKDCFGKAVVLVVICCLTTSMVGADINSAMVSGGSGVTVNGKAAVGNFTIVPGDKLANTGESNVKIVKEGLAIEVGPQSVVSYDPQRLNVTSGSVAVSTKNAFKATSKDIVVETTGKNARFVISETDNKRVIAAVRSFVRVTDGTSTYELPEGRALVQDRTPEPATKGDVGNGGKKDDKPNKGKSARGKSLPGWVEVAIVGGVAGGILGGFAAAGVFEESKMPSSPAIP